MFVYFLPLFQGLAIVPLNPRPRRHPLKPTRVLARRLPHRCGGAASLRDPWRGHRHRPRASHADPARAPALLPKRPAERLARKVLRRRDGQVEFFEFLTQPIFPICHTPFPYISADILYSGGSRTPSSGSPSSSASSTSRYVWTPSPFGGARLVGPPASSASLVASPSFGVPQFWCPSVLVSLSFGVPQFWRPPVLPSPSFAVPQFWRPPVLASPNFGVAQFWCRPILMSCQFSHPPNLLAWRGLRGGS